MNWKDVTRDELIELYVHKRYSDQRVADLFGVTKSQAAYKRKNMAFLRT